MITQQRLRLEEVERQVCEIVTEVLHLPIGEARPESRLIEDLHCDSLDMINLIMSLEERFDANLDNNLAEPAAKAVFTRQPFRLADMAELVFLRQGTSRESERRSRGEVSPAINLPSRSDSHGFLQLGGRWRNLGNGDNWLLEPLDNGSDGIARYRRRSDGMPCVRIPSDSVEIGGEPNRPSDEQPRHVVEIDAFVIDAEPVSSTAYCRFLNSIDETSPKILADWFMLDSNDDRETHMPIRLSAAGWEPMPGADYWPMMLVSWFGANAYSLWANGWDWRLYQKENDPQAPCFLPSEAQWEYAARGPRAHAYPWGDEAPTPDHARYGRHEPATAYEIEDLPLANVHEPLGTSPFGLRHMAGNVWNWCRDWYDPEFYRRAESTSANALNRSPTGIRSERGGSWVGPEELCRSSYRRGRQPLARGRCLGFRCVSSLKDASGRA